MVHRSVAGRLSTLSHYCHPRYGNVYYWWPSHLWHDHCFWYVLPRRAGILKGGGTLQWRLFESARKLQSVL